MIQILAKQNCCGCQACAQICPQRCIRMRVDEEGFLYPELDSEGCTQCDLCKKVCPVLHSAQYDQKNPSAYAAYNLAEEVRRVSSSGGIFTLLAGHVLAQRGIVYGAAMENLRVKHIRVVDPDGLDALRGSKYVQSDIGQTYIQAKLDLEAGKTVLFTGTPCQIEGLKSFLLKEYENLITMDLICHGVPSPMVWEKYVVFREKSAGTTVTQVFFRHKIPGWKLFSMFFLFSNKTEYVQNLHQDLFMQAFLQDLCLRHSCYQCSFKKVNRISDITVADFWGIETVCPELDDDKGTSLVLLHSKRGEAMFYELRNQLCCKEVDLEVALYGNPAMRRSARKPEKRDAFMKDICKEPFDTVVQKYVKPRRNITVKSVIKEVLSRLGLLTLARKLLKKQE